MSETATDIDSLWDYEDPAASEGRFREWLPSVQASGDAAALAELLTQIARSEGLQRRFDAAHATLDQAEAILPREPAAPRIRYLLERGRTLNSSGRPEDSRPYFLQALEAAQDAGEDFYAVDAAHMMGIVEPPDGQIEWNRRAIELAEASSSERARGWLGSLYNNIGWSYHSLGDFDTALDYFQRGLEFQTARGRERQARIASWTVARCLRSLGRTEEALSMQLANQVALEQAGEPDGFTQEELGECLLALDRAEEARPHFARAHEVLSKDPWLEANEPERLQRLAELAQP